MSGFLSGRTSLTTVQTADIADDAVTEAKMATDAIGITELKAGTDGNIISYDASGNPVAVATGSDGQVLTSSGAGAVCAFEDASGGFTLGTDTATTSGTSVTFGSIPSGTTMIVVMFEGVSKTTAGAFAVTIGDAGGLETSGYSSVSSHGTTNTNSSGAGFAIFGIAANYLHGTMILCLKDASNFTWVESHAARHSGTDNATVGGGSKDLSAELTQVAISAPSGALDAGSINIMYQ